eukprot:TRINITY_DN345_c1_g6_i2.p1 TRINITY_DN345_c1_g6~~TRINITY_DN345_c1_g6_i2.p1  ORF type:complete len:625 (-),score=107.10 TRINITY_DN345_c1_g6_i2:199-2073(-)
MASLASIASQNSVPGGGGGGLKIVASGSDPQTSTTTKATSPRKTGGSRRTKSDSGVNTKVVKGYTIGDGLGQGAYGKVFRGLNLKTGEVVAIKQIDKHLIAPEDWPLVLQELNLLQHLTNPNIVQFIDYHETNDFLYFILEFVEGGSLYSVVKKFGALPDRLLVLFIVQVLRGLRYLHSRGVMHRDIKGANILLTKEGTCKLADFGSATYAAVNKQLEAKGTPFWMAPELIDQSASAGLASDIWSLGCTVIELLTGEPPYWKLGPVVALFRMTKDLHPPLPDESQLTPNLKDFLMKCFERDVTLRPTADDLLRHPWVTSIWGEEPVSIDLAKATPEQVHPHSRRLTTAIGNLFKKLPTLSSSSSSSSATASPALGMSGGRARSSSNSDELPLPLAMASAPAKMEEQPQKERPKSERNASFSDGSDKEDDKRKSKKPLKDSMPKLAFAGSSKEAEDYDVQLSLNLSPRMAQSSKLSNSGTNPKVANSLSPRLKDMGFNITAKKAPGRSNSDEVKGKKLIRRDSKESSSGTDEDTEIATKEKDKDKDKDLKGEGKQKKEFLTKRCLNCAKWAALEKERTKEREENKLLVQTLQTSVTLMAQEFDTILDRTKRVVKRLRLNWSCVVA